MLFCLVLFSVVAYLLGSIPSAVWIGKIFYGVDVREHGSGNAGTTNVLRVLGGRAAIPVFAIDIAKGLLAVLAVYLIPDLAPNSEKFALIKILFAALAVLGHMYPVFAGFRGGKGVATMLGAAVAIQPWGALVALAVFVLVFCITRYVSLSSMSGGVAFPLSVIFLFHEPTIAIKIFALFACLLLFYTHRQNIKRLRAGTESKTTFKKKIES
ncbi:MAG: glycerol-3-phosphate 1-O-acyltransferase PlsY [Prevotellaceae bacterium]|nr:glycerol-3-phosphate 1-O-acyltransferase PlsY [Prevotellaceae bacterium]